MPTTSLRKTALEPQNGICRSHTEIFHHQCCNNTDQIRIPAQISARWVNKEKANGCSREEIGTFCTSAIKFCLFILHYWIMVL